MTSDKLKFLLRQTRPWGVISAHKADLHPTLNNTRELMLLDEIARIDRGYLAGSIFEQDGNWNGQRESSFLIFGITQAQLEILGKQFQQESVLHSNDVEEILFLDHPAVNSSTVYANSREKFTWQAIMKQASGQGV